MIFHFIIYICVEAVLSSKDRKSVRATGHQHLNYLHRMGSCSVVHTENHHTIRRREHRKLSLHKISVRISRCFLSYQTNITIHFTRPNRSKYDKFLAIAYKHFTEVFSFLIAWGDVQINTVITLQ